MLTIAFEFLKSFFSKIGITGILLLSLSAICGIQYYMIGSKNEKIVKQKVYFDEAIKSLKDGIKEQNKAVETESQVKKEIQKSLDETVKSNLILRQKFLKASDDLKKKPIATTCDGSIDEIRISAKQNADDWNKQ